MAWSLTDRGTFTRNASSTNITTASFTPAANCLLLVFCFYAHGITSISGHDDGASWVQLIDESTGEEAIEVWGCFTGSSPTAGTMTITISYEWEATYLVVEVDETVNGVDTSGTVANAIGTHFYESLYMTNDNNDRTVTLAAFDDADNLTLVFGGGVGNLPETWEAGFTQLSEETTNEHNGEIRYKTSEDTSFVVSFGWWFNNLLCAFEVKQGAAAGGGDLTVNVHDCAETEVCLV